MKLTQLYRTLRYLRFSQVVWRIRYRIQRSLEFKPWFGVAGRTARRVRSSNLNWSRNTTAADVEGNPAWSAKIFADLNAGYLTLLNERLPHHGGNDWCMVGGRESSRLWRYTLHYHGWLVGLAHEQSSEELIAAQLTDWMDTCILGGCGFNHYPWNSYAIATRLDNWRQLVAKLPKKFWSSRPELKQRFCESMRLQTQYLLDHLEWDLRGNHLLRDALGLASASSVIDGPLKSRAQTAAIDLAKGQMDEQILGDGSHFELSPMYHVEFMLDLVKLYQLVPDDELREQITTSLQRMWEYVGWVQHLDGSLVQFNDGSVAKLDDIRRSMIAAGLNVESYNWLGAKILKESGVAVWRNRGWVVIMNAGSMGPPYQPGHAHADTLSLELSIDRHRVFIDPGTHSYDLDERRRYDRRTRSHNTIEIDDEDSSEVWHIFRLGERAHTTDVVLDEGGDYVKFRASHDGYRRLPGQPIHERVVECSEVRGVTVSDRVRGEGFHKVSGGWLLAPEWKVTEVENGWRIEFDKTCLLVKTESMDGLELTVKEVPIHPDYGVEQYSRRLEWMVKTELPLKVQTHINFVER